VASCIAEQCGLTPFAKVGAVLRKSAAPAVLCNQLSELIKPWLHCMPLRHFFPSAVPLIANLKASQ
jgi:hypothetical protein